MSKNRAVLTTILSLGLVLVLTLLGLLNSSISIFENNEPLDLRGFNSITYLDSDLNPLHDYGDDNFITSNFVAIELDQLPPVSLENISVDIEFAVTSGVDAIEIYADSEKKVLVYSRFLEKLELNSFSEEGFRIWQSEDKFQSLGGIVNDPNIDDKEFLLVNTDINLNVTPSDYIGMLDSKMQHYVPIRRSFMASFYGGGDIPVEFSINKRDLNLYTGADPLEVSILDSTFQEISSYTFEGDGITSRSSFSQQVSTYEISEQLEEGTYYILFEQDDSIVESIDTNVSKFVFLDTLFLANNEEYTNNARTVSLVTDANNLYITPIHSFAKQEVLFGESAFSISNVNTEDEINSEIDGLKQFVSPIGDIVVKSSNAFATHESFYFNPRAVQKYRLNSDIDTSGFDYVVAEYEPVRNNGSYYTKEFSVDLTKEILQSDVLLIIKTSKASVDDGVIIKDINISYD